jgi:hypothetical protein
MRPALLAALACAAVVALSAQPPSAADDVLEKAIAYVAAYQHDFVGVVAEETYRQTTTLRSGTDSRGFPRESSQRRDLKSDLLLVRTPGADEWLQFRDVFEVDGKAVRDRDDRLVKLFLQPQASVQAQIDDITNASARYNIGGITRNVNIPVLALAVLDAANRRGFTFTLSQKKDQSIIEYQEHRAGTLIRSNGNEPTPTHGRITVETATGRVLSTELVAEARRLTAAIEVTYGAEPAIGLLVPREMREKYTSEDGTRIEGHATYARYRRYQVLVDDKVKKR